MKRLTKAAALCLLCLALGGCDQNPPADTAEDPFWAEHRAKAQDNARRREEFARSELHAYVVSYFTDLLTELFPERNIGNFEIIIIDDAPADELLEPLNGDTDMAFELMRTANFGIEINHSKKEPEITFDERAAIMNALAEKKFTVELFFDEFNDWNYITDGEIEIQPIPGY
ncbi:MAG: hypothetical protein IK093_19135 [Ruminiclostridium sp.]|nr:hypothetical protein [Ruminiclostridium sp.]